MKSAIEQVIFDVLSGLNTVAPAGEHWDEYAAREIAAALDKEALKAEEKSFTGVSDEADFSADTWSFKMYPGYQVGAGQYRITRIKGD